MEAHAPFRYFRLCSHCREAFYATVSRFTPKVCKHCGWDNGPGGTAVAYGDKMWSANEMAAMSRALWTNGDESPEPGAWRRNHPADWQAGLAFTGIFVAFMALLYLAAALATG